MPSIQAEQLHKSKSILSDNAFSVCSAQPQHTLKAGAPLGTNTGIDASHEYRGFQQTANHEIVDLDTGEITSLSGLNSEQVSKTPQQSRAHRYSLKSVVNRLIPDSRTAKCCRVRILGQDVKILKSSEHNKAHYGGLVRCGSVWACPVCAAKISERRRVELVSATATANLMGLKVFLMTVTIPHGLGDDLSTLLDQMQKAWRKTTVNRDGVNLRKDFGFIGTIRAFEVTHGQNGFHPHFHVLVFAKTDLTALDLQQAYFPLWRNACVKSGLPPPSELHGLRVDDGSKAAKYASKWGLEDEMTKGHTKTSKGDKGQTPWDFLNDVLKSKSSRSQALFLIYLSAFKGRRQLFWSKGLRELLALGNEATDEELASMDQDESYELAQLTIEQWRAVLLSCSEALLLDIAERNPLDIQPYLSSLVSMYSVVELTVPI